MPDQHMADRREVIIANAHIVTPDRAFLGHVRVVDGLIEDIGEGSSVPAGAIDLGGDFLLPGLVELHTDNLERHLHPRPGVDWPRRAALVAHDGEFASAGATTVLDALRVGSMGDGALNLYAKEAEEAADDLRALGLLRAEHFIHLRCELTADNVIEEFDAIAGNPRVRLISVMDHTPGQRQFEDVTQYVKYYKNKRKLDEEGMAAFMKNARRLQLKNAVPNRAALGTRARAGAFAVASHDDARPEHVAESLEMGATLAEFPTTLAAARASREAGLKVIMGAPNLLRGFSHSGNVAAGTLAEDGLLDILSSDYAPASLMLAAFKLAEEVEAYDLPRAIATVSKTPAEAVGLSDRGAIEVGRRADLARVYHVERLCVVRALWREGKRVM
jgi:alpha-D-ribose 1-methylphosphonate 5-triphosphate diphosphatase